MRIFLAGMLSVLLLACAGPQDPPPGDPGGGETPAPPGDGASKGSEAPPDAWNCRGALVPPTGWEQETSFEATSTPNASQKAADRARLKLRERLCGGASSCDDLESRITLWKTGSGDGQVCAMVVIEALALEDWRKGNTSLSGLEQSLLSAAKELVKGRKNPRVAIDKIIDNGAAGGARAEWLEERMARALGQAGASVGEMPRSWNGRGMPPGIQAVIGATATVRVERQRAVVEVIWSARVRGRVGIDKVVAKPVLFPADAAPASGVAVPLLPPSDPNLSVRLETQRGGSLCLGERTQLWLYSKTDQHVRVFDLYGKDGALLLFPNPDRPDDRVRAGEAIPLGGELGFEAIPAPGSEVERFLVIAAPASKGLGRFESWKGYCRVPTSVASSLHRGKGVPATAKAVSDSFRLIERSDCPTKPSMKNIQGQAQALATLPECQ